jgi:Na+-transporting methylmalonyl-CoA/oxaloacetate decarboxylase gamma subunit
MDRGTFGITLLVVGMGGTLVTLFLLTLLIKGITRIFPASTSQPEDKKE